MAEQTKGEQMVRVRFNPSENDDVNQIKQTFAKLIDTVVAQGKDPRLNSIAITHLETASMYAVKSLTA